MAAIIAARTAAELAINHSALVAAGLPHQLTALEYSCEVSVRLRTIACFCRYAEQEGHLRVSPAVHVHRPRLDYESHATGFDCNEVGAMLVAAGPRVHW